jgi:hypothetical protein
LVNHRFSSSRALHALVTKFMAVESILDQVLKETYVLTSLLYPLSSDLLTLVRG